MKSKYEFIDNEAALVRACDHFRSAPWLAIDTEFEREKTYYPELCLLQLTDAERVLIIDPLAIGDLGSLFDLLYQPGIIKHFHAARQDLELFFNLRGAVPGPVFDTQLAAPLLGYDEQAGYANLVQKMLGVNLGKTQTRTDWKQRPLKPAQLDYAADDVIYLAQIYTLIVESLLEKNRLAWLDDDFSALCDPALYQVDPGSAWKKNRGARKLRGKKLCALQHMAAWRETRAQAENRPRKWIIRDETLLNIAQLLPASQAELAPVKGLHEKQLKKYAASLLAIIRQAETSEDQEAVQPQTRKSLNKKEEAKLDALAAIVRLVACENDLHPNVLAPRAELEKFIRGQNNCILMKGWREQLIGRELRDFLAEKSSLKVIDGKLVYQSE